MCPLFRSFTVTLSSLMTVHAHLYISLNDLRVITDGFNEEHLDNEETVKFALPWQQWLT